MKVGVVVPTFKRPEYLDKCLQNISDASIADGIRKTVYVVLHGDKGRLVDDRLKESMDIVPKYSFAKMVINPYSFGTGSSRKEGSKAAIADGCEYIINTDDDCRFYDNSFSTVLEVLENNPDIGLASSSSGGMLSVFNHSDCEESEEKFVVKPTATGSFAAVRAELLEKIGNYDFNLTSKEDLEVCYRVWLSGSKCAIATDCKIKHKGHMPGGIQSTSNRRDDGLRRLNKYIEWKYNGFVKVSKNGSWLWWNNFKKISVEDRLLLLEDIKEIRSQTKIERKA
jgi:GT2 family glycosyltransferase